MTSPFSPEQLVFLQQFVTSIVRSMVGEDSRTEHKVEPETKANVKPMEEPMTKPKVEPKAASKPKARPKRKFRAPTNQSIEGSPSPKVKNPKANHVVASIEPSKPPIVFQNPAPKENFSVPRTDNYCVCLRCSQVRQLDCRAVIPRAMQAVPLAPPKSRVGCFNCGDPGHFARDCPHPRSIPNPRNPYFAPCLRIFVQQERDVDLIRDPHQNPDRAQISANPSLEFKDDQAQGSQGSMNE